MVRYRLTNFLNKHPTLQGIFLSLIFALFIVYISSFTLDLYNVVNTSVLNTLTIESDTTLRTINNYEIEGTTVTIDGIKYEDVSIVFYGVSSDDDTVYFSDSTSTLIQSLPRNFGVSFLISSNSFICVISLLCITLVLFILNNTKEYKLILLSTKICYLSLAFSLILVGLMFLAFLLLY